MDEVANVRGVVCITTQGLHGSTCWAPPSWVLCVLVFGMI